MGIIKEDIIQKIIDRVTEMTTTAWNYQYQEFNRATYRVTTLPAISVYPRTQTAAEKPYGIYDRQLEIRIEANIEYDPDIDTPDSAAVKAETDLQEAFFGGYREINYTSGLANPGYSESDLIGETATTSWGSYVIEKLTTDSGVWPTGTAAGTFTIKRLVGDFAVEPVVIGAIGGFTMAGTVAAYVNTDKMVFGNTLPVLEVQYVGSGVDGYPEMDDTSVITFLDILIRYRQVNGEFYI